MTQPAEEPANRSGCGPGLVPDAGEAVCMECSLTRTRLYSPMSHLIHRLIYSLYLHKTPLAHTAIYCRTSQIHESQPRLTGKPGHAPTAIWLSAALQSALKCQTDCLWLSAAVAQSHTRITPYRTYETRCSRARKGGPPSSHHPLHTLGLTRAPHEPSSAPCHSRALRRHMAAASPQ